jgi:plasmid stability protein
MINDPSPPAAGAAVTVRGLAPELKARLRVRAAHNARSMEAEARAILEAALSGPEEDATDLASFAQGLFGPLGGIELELPKREPAREPPSFGTGQEVAAEPVASPKPAQKPGNTPRRGMGAPAETAAAAPAKGRGRRA